MDFFFFGDIIKKGIKIFSELIFVSMSRLTSTFNISQLISFDSLHKLMIEVKN